MTLPSFEVTVGDCVEVMRGLPECSVDAVVCDPPYGLEFMGKAWDRLDGDAWRAGAGFSKPGIGDRETAWPSYGAGNSANPTCATCGGRKRGKKRCSCDQPDWRVKGQPMVAAGVDSRQAQGRKMQTWHEMWAVEALRVLKPGGHLLAFGGTRTFHRMTVAIEDAGFEVRDCLSWLYGSGFPKSLDVSKAIDKAAGAEREVVGTRVTGAAMSGRASGESLGTGGTDFGSGRNEVPVTAPATPESARWEGWGTALKPAWEPIVLARKPLIGTVAANVLEHGTGGLNIDGSRIGTPSEVKPQVRETTDSGGASWGKGDHVPFHYPPGGGGRWPANVLLDEEAAAILDQQSGVRPGGQFPAKRGQAVATAFASGQETSGGARAMGDTGGASRFFYVAKASRRDRNEGLDGMPEGQPVGGADKWTETDRRRGDGVTRKAAANVHPTVKPTTLMRHLVRLVTPPDGLILDPFCGSGSTGKAAMLEGFRFHGIEQDAEYAEIARRRIGWAAEEAARQPPTLGV